MKFVDAAGHPVEPSALGRGYWYRTDCEERVRWARRTFGTRAVWAQEKFYGSDLWMAVQRVLAAFRPHAWDCPEPVEHLGVNIRNEIAFEVA